MPDTCRPVSLIIFGATGDLTSRKLVPALYSNFLKRRLPACPWIVGFARRPWTEEEFRNRLRDGAAESLGGGFNPAAWGDFAGRIKYFQGQLDARESFSALRTFLDKLEFAPADRLYYLATAPEFFPTIVDRLGESGLAEETGGLRRLVVEKPFGRDERSARALNRLIHARFAESRVYRMDHYLAKETAQNILFFRFANSLFEPLWNRRHVHHVQISVTENLEVGSRAPYYDAAGVVRDMFQNHLLQLLALVAMEPPASFSADAVRSERVRLYRRIRPVRLKDTVRGQYAGYGGTEGVAPGSATPTFAAWKLRIANDRWRGVPFYLRSGKALREKRTEIAVVFRKAPWKVFALEGCAECTPNILMFGIQPDEGIHLRLNAKVPDSGREMRAVEMDYHFRESFGGGLPDAYERLLLDAFKGDASLFPRSDGIELCWRLADPVIAGWEGRGAPPLEVYDRGSWGPAGADELLARDGRAWILAQHETQAEWTGKK
jgi:glucose-6-phosphate 1-dehydrogenase